MAHTAGAKRGRPATASREDVLRVVRDQYLSGQRVDVTVVARELGLGRATIYRWFGSRERLISEVIVREFDLLLEHKRAQARGRGAQWLVAVLDGVNRALSHSTALRRLVEQERQGALRLLTSSGGAVQPRVTAAFRELIEQQVQSGAYRPPASAETLAYALVRLMEAFLYNDAVIGIRGDHERLREVQAALLGAPR
ncbi:MAG TPA: QsdR family transcriptional regulator [Solirubrobacteraceae bacterium]|nr:QsdR family transcriptional regulator [Solirubrobacteraceae bacterium]